MMDAFAEVMRTIVGLVVTLITPLWLWIAGLVVGAVLIYEFGL